MKFKVRVLPRVPNPANKAISPFLSPKVLFLARLLMFIYAAVVIINHVLQYRHDDHAFWPYLTVLSYYCLTFYLFVSLVHIYHVKYINKIRSFTGIDYFYWILCF
jgi:hypothetical protein